MLPIISMEARLAADPELRFAPSGVAVCTLRLVASKRKQNDAGDWVDDKTFWVTAKVFKQMAENSAESFVKGDLILVTGTLQTDEWTTEGGDKRSAPALMVNTIGPSLQFRTVPHGAGRTERTQAATPAASDPWATGATTPDTDEPPF